MTKPAEPSEQQLAKTLQDALDMPHDMLFSWQQLIWWPLGCFDDLYDLGCFSEAAPASTTVCMHCEDQPTVDIDYRYQNNGLTRRTRARCPTCGAIEVPEFHTMQWTLNRDAAWEVFKKLK